VSKRLVFWKPSSPLKSRESIYSCSLD